MEHTYTLQELTKEEADALTKDLQEVLKKHNCEMGVTSSINLMKRVENEIETSNEDIPSPYVENETSITEKETDTTPEKSSEGDSGEPTKE